MSSGSNNLTTYYAKRIIGDTAAANASSALLQTGTGIDTNTWILNRTNRVSTYGIKYVYDSSTSTVEEEGQESVTVNNGHDKIEFHGGGANASAWVQLDTGDFYAAGKVGIGYNPNTSGNTYKLYVNGAWNLIGDSAQLMDDGVSGCISIKGQNNLTGINFQPYTSGKTVTCKLWLNDNSTNGELCTDRDFWITVDDARSISCGSYRKNSVSVACYVNSSGTNHGIYSWGYSDGTTYTSNGKWLVCRDTAGNVTLDGNAATATALTSNAGSGEQPIYFTGGTPSATTYALKATVNDSTAGYFVYYSTARAVSGTSNARLTDGCLNLYPSSGTYREGIRIYPTGSWSTIVLGGNDLSATSGTSANSWTIHNNNGTFYINKNASNTAGNPRAMGTSTGWTFGNTTLNSYALNAASFICASWVRTKGSTGWYNEDYAGGWYMSDAKWIRSFNSKPILIDIGTNNTYGQGGHRLALGLSGGSHVSLMMKGGDVMYGFCVNNDGNWYFGKRTSKSFESTSGDAYCYYGTNTAILPYTDNAVTCGNSSKRWSAVYGVKVYNAVWNDYAECRHSSELEPGRCVTETSTMNGMIRTTKRLLPGCKLVSDTYGTLMGETDKAKTPIAVSGRVLAYPYRAKEEYSLGAAVCSAPNGTVDIMTREEIMIYPERIVGTVSEIPTYEIWSGGSQNGKDDIQVNGRIWIYVR